MPRTLRGRGFPPQDIKIAIICAYFIKLIMRAIPLVKHFLDQVLVPVKSKTNRPFFCLETGIAIYLKLDTLGLAHRKFTADP